MKILEILGSEKRVSVLDLSERLKVSDVTIRKDLSVLEEQGFLRREHGFATMTSDDVSTRLLFNYETKRRIARAALESITDGETVMIESGSCCALLAQEIAENRRNVTIITNSVFIAMFLKGKSGVRIILPGGELQNESQVLIGPLVGKCAANFRVEKIFMGTDGFDETGAMSGDLMRAEAVRNMAKSARRAIILTESKKFFRSGVVPLLSYDEIDMIYTDEKLPHATQENLSGLGIQIILPDD